MEMNILDDIQALLDMPKDVMFDFDTLTLDVLSYQF